MTAAQAARSAVPEPRLEMRPYERTDLAYLRALSEQPSVRRLTGLPADGDDRDWERYVRERHNSTSWILMMRLEERPVGVLYVVNLGAPELYQVGYCVDERLRNQGVATRAVSATVASLFGGTRCVRVQATVEPHNAASRRVLEKCGFEREGLMRRGVKIGEALVDAELYAALRP